MANKRMFSKIITNSEEFLDMPVSTQALYFHLNMNADDDGFVQPKIIMRMVGCNNQDDLNVLLVKGFVVKVADKVIVIKHWHVNNTVRTDRYTPTIYKEHLKFLGLDDNKVYFETDPKQQITDGKPDGNHAETQISIDKVSIGKDSKDKYYYSSLFINNVANKHKLTYSYNNRRELENRLLGLKKIVCKRMDGANYNLNDAFAYMLYRMGDECYGWYFDKTMYPSLNQVVSGGDESLFSQVVERMNECMRTDPVERWDAKQCKFVDARKKEQG